jgi:hypothetical protein
MPINRAVAGLAAKDGIRVAQVAVFADLYLQRRHSAQVLEYRDLWHPWPKMADRAI